MRDEEMVARALLLRLAVREAAIGVVRGQLPATWDEFYDLAEDARFIAQCSLVDDTTVTASLEALGKRLFGSHPVRHLATFLHEPTGIRHGVATLTGRLATWFWFPMDGMGLVAVHRHDGAVTYAVITRLRIAAPANRLTDRV